MDAANICDRPLAGPLEAYAFDVFARLRIAQTHLDQFRIWPLQGPEEDLHAALLHLRTQIADEARQPFGGPRTTGEHLRRVELVLGHDHADAYALLAVLIHEATEVGGVGAEIALLLDKHVGPLLADLIGPQPVRHALLPRRGHRRRVVFVVFHPGRRAPRRRPELQFGLVLERALDEGDERLEVVGDAEVLEGEVVGRLVV